MKPEIRAAIHAALDAAIDVSEAGDAHGFFEWDGHLHCVAMSASPVWEMYRDYLSVGAQKLCRQSVYLSAHDSAEALRRIEEGERELRALRRDAA